MSTSDRKWVSVSKEENSRKERNKLVEQMLMGYTVVAFDEMNTGNYEAVLVIIDSCYTYLQIVGIKCTKNDILSAFLSKSVISALNSRQLLMQIVESSS